jgi:hypothetical protein
MVRIFLTRKPFRERALERHVERRAFSAAVLNPTWRHPDVFDYPDHFESFQLFCTGATSTTMRSERVSHRVSIALSPSIRHWSDVFPDARRERCPRGSRLSLFLARDACLDISPNLPLRSPYDASDLGHPSTDDGPHLWHDLSVFR